MKRILLLLMFGLGLFYTQAQTPITIDDTQTVQQLVDDILVLGNCAEVSNISSPNNSAIGGDTFNSFAAFDGAASVPPFPFSSGIVLASNGVDMIPTGAPVQNGGFAWAGDPDLEALINEPGNTNNATVIEFDFIPFVEEISFNYFLASDEYPTFVCTFADTFAFILSGPGISNVNDYNHDANPNTPDLTLDLGGLNIATLPGTNIPVNPTNVHDLTANCGPGALGEFAVPQLYDSAGEDDGTSMYFGRTVPLAATAQVIPGQTYNIKLAVADRGDTILNTAVFLESSSFDLGGIDLGPDITIINGTAPCEGDVVTLDAGFSATNIQYFWAVDGNIIPGENGQTLDVTQPGTYEVGIQIGSTGAACFGVSNQVVIEFYPEPTFDPSLPFTLCAGDTLVLDGEPSNASAYTSINYSWSKDGVEIVGETNSTLTVTDGGTYEVIVDANACDDAPNTFIVNLIDYQVSITDPGVACIGDTDVVTLTPAFTGLTQDQIDNDVTYLWTTDTGTFTTSTIDIAEGQTVSLTTTFEGCDESVTETFTFFNTPVVDITGDAFLCDGLTNTLDATPLNLANLTSPTYSWTLDGNPITGDMATLDITAGGTYEVSVDNNGCITTDSIVVELIDYSVSLPVPADPCIAQGETVTLTPGFTGLTQDQIDNDLTYTWSTNETTPTIEVSQSGTYTVTTTFNGCDESVTETFTFFEDPLVSINGLPTLCVGDTNTLDATPMNLNALVNPTYSWTLDGNPITGDMATLDITAGGTYVVTVDNNGCTTSASFDVESINAEVTISTDTGDTVLCTGTGGSDTLTLIPDLPNLTSAQQSQVNYFWSDGSNGETLTVTESGTYFLDVDVNGECLQTSNSVDILLLETVDISLADAIKCPDDDVTLTPVFSSTPSGATYTWTLPDGTTETGQTLTTSEEGDYILTVDNQGCVSDIVVNVGGYNVQECVITQGISPNEDQFNNCMDLQWLSDESGIRKMTVFNRYGRMVFEENNYVNTFCGQDENGNELSTGTYFYVIELENPSAKVGNNSRVIKGWVYVNAPQ